MSVDWQVFAHRLAVKPSPEGDSIRPQGPPFYKGFSFSFLAVNRNKRSIVIDMRKDEGKALARRLALAADVIVENFRPGVMARLGLGYEALSRENPRLVFASISGFGCDGPERDRPGYDMIIQAISGSMHTSAAPGEDAAKIAFPVSDIVASLFAGNAILAALYARERTGRGRFVEVSLLEGMLCAQSNLAGSVLLADADPPQVGVAQGNIAPYQLFHCKDAPIIAGALNQRLWGRFCKAVGREDLVADPRFADNPARSRNRAELIEILKAVLRAETAAHWLARFEANEVPCGPVLSMRQALALPQAVARGAVVDVEPGAYGAIRLVGSPMRMEGYEPRYRSPASLGEHTEGVRREFLGE
jgi:crotonobetainyl-CoA:carnitine CoA-transferase CaiB-like acyl-CoA transferase